MSARSIAAVQDTITLAQLRLLVVPDSRGPMKLIGLAELPAVNPSAATRMVDRLVAVDVVDRRPNPTTRREVVIGLTSVGTFRSSSACPLTGTGLGDRFPPRRSG